MRLDCLNHDFVLQKEENDIRIFINDSLRGGVSIYMDTATMLIHLTPWFVPK
jgi:hypothetical protein